MFEPLLFFWSVVVTAYVFNLVASYFCKHILSTGLFFKPEICVICRSDKQAVLNTFFGKAICSIRLTDPKRVFQLGCQLKSSSYVVARLTDLSGSCFYSWVDRPFNPEVAEVESFTELTPSFSNEICDKILIIESCIIV